MVDLTRATMSVAEAILTRRSIRAFRPDPVEDDRIRALLEAAVHAPTAMHVEPWLFVVISDRAALQRYSDVARVTLLQEAELYRDLHDPSPRPKNGGFLEELARPDFSVFYNAGTAILIGCRPTNPFVTGDCWLAAGHVLLAAHALGLGACCVGSALPAFRDPAVRDELHIPPDVTIVACIIVGLPADRPVSAGRRDPVVLTWKRGRAAGA